MLPDLVINANKERKYFSYLGRVVKSKKIDWLIDLAEFMLINNIKEELLILSASKLPLDKLNYFIKNGLKIKIINPKFLTDKEISKWLLQSKAVFCMHKGISQSGVFVESMRHKTPIIGLEQEGLLQFFDNCGVLINNPRNPSEIINSFELINKNLDCYSKNAEVIFKNEFSSKNFLKHYNFLFKKNHS